MITIDDFGKIEMRVGKVLTAEAIEGSEKLVKLNVDFGPAAGGASAEPRQVLSGIKKSYPPESLVGRSFIFVTNLEPRIIMGLESNGMILAVADSEGLPILYTFDKEVAPGTKVK